MQHSIRPEGLHWCEDLKRWNRRSWMLFTWESSEVVSLSLTGTSYFLSADEHCWLTLWPLALEECTTLRTSLTYLDECFFHVADAANSPWMVFEFMPHGDLAEVLRSNSRQFWKPVPGLAPLTKVRRFGSEKWKRLMKGCYTKQQPKFGTESRICKKNFTCYPNICMFSYTQHARIHFGVSEHCAQQGLNSSKAQVPFYLSSNRW